MIIRYTYMSYLLGFINAKVKKYVLVVIKYFIIYFLLII